MAPQRFTPGDTVRVWYVQDGATFEYTAKVLRPAERQGDYVVQVLTAGPGSGATEGAIYAPILGGPVGMDAA
jgi:hypothetical protein